MRLYSRPWLAHQLLTSRQRSAAAAGLKTLNHATKAFLPFVNGGRFIHTFVYLLVARILQSRGAGSAHGREGQGGQKRDIKFAEAFIVWLKISLLSFGGPAGQIAVMHRLLVDELKWVSEKRFLHALNFCMLLPGPEAQQLTIYLGWLLHRVRGGVVAGVLFVLPGALTVLVLSMIYVTYQQAMAVNSIFFGVKAAVLAIVTTALWRLARKVLRKKFLAQPSLYRLFSPVLCSRCHSRL